MKKNKLHRSILSFGSLHFYCDEYKTLSVKTFFGFCQYDRAGVNLTPMSGSQFIIPFSSDFISSLFL